ncbi:MAG: hypothetical protein IT448_06620 [Phycisphaerales bacterium]|nr:hypothetical protein [Phycisphaerales bacterium]
MQLTKHENITFTNATVYLSGQAFIKCTFVACTLVLREPLYHMDGCRFERCNWHIDRTVMWGNRESLRDLRWLVDMLEKNQQQLESAREQQAPGHAGGQAQAEAGA